MGPANRMSGGLNNHDYSGLTPGPTTNPDLQICKQSHIEKVWALKEEQALYTVSTNQINFLIYSEVADSTLCTR